MSRAGIDSKRSWLVAVACFVVQMVTFGLTESQGLLFVSAVTRFDTTRGRASLPFTLAYCVRSAIGPFIGYIGRRFGIRIVTLCGCILSSISVATCFFAEDIVEFTVLWGVVFGISLGLETSLLCVIINEHFVKNRVKANGLNVSGASIGVLVLSPIIHYIVEVYGLSGTFLIISGIMLHSIPATLVMLITKPEEPAVNPLYFINDSVSIASMSTTHTPSFVKKKMPVCYEEPEEENHTNMNTNSNHVTKNETPNKKKNSTVILSVSQLKPRDMNFFPKLWTKTRKYTVNSIVGEMKCAEDIENKHKELGSSLSYDSVFTRRMSVNNYSLKLATRQSSRKIQHYPIDPIGDSNNPDKSKWQVQRLFCDPIYIFIVIGSGIYYFSITSTYTIIIDYAQDIGVPKEYSAYILMWVALSDLCAFPFLGWIIERGYLTQGQYGAISFLGLSLTSQAMVWCPSIAVLLVIVTCFELSQCGVIILTAPLVAEYVDSDLQATGIASVTILSSPITLAISPLVGYFRDKGGSYAGVFYVISAGTFLCSILLACIPKLEKRRKGPRPKRKLGRNLAFVGGH